MAATIKNWASEIVSDGFSFRRRVRANCHARFQIPCLEATLRTSTASAGVRAFWIATFWRFTPALCRKVRTMAPIIAVSRMKTRRLEEIEILGVQHPPERHGIRHAGRHRRRDIGDCDGPASSRRRRQKRPRSAPRGQWVRQPANIAKIPCSNSAKSTSSIMTTKRNKTATAPT